MKKPRLPILAACSALLFGFNNIVSAQTTFSYAGAVQTYAVPSGVSLLSIDAGGGSGGNDAMGAGPAGKGGRVQCDMSVTPGQILYFYVGGRGTDGSMTISGVPGGWNGGGNSTFFYVAGGGGATDIRTGGTSLSDRVMVAGAGGGGAYNCSTGMNGGAGGGLVGDTSWACATKHYGGMCYNATGGTQTAGGQNGTCLGGSASLAVGANGGSYGGGGGGGFYGGGGGNMAGGGGGSSYTDPSTMSSVVHTQGYNSGNGYVTFTTSCPLPVISVITGTTTVSISGTSALSDATPSGVWSCSNTSIATVSSGGLLTGMSAGTAIISYSVTNSCGTSSTTTTATVTSGGLLQVANTSGTDRVGVYPNPTSGVVNIQWNNQPTGAGVVRITDMVGREVFRSAIAVNVASGVLPVNLKDLSNGFYLLSVKTDNINYCGKMLIQK